MRAKWGFAIIFCVVASTAEAAPPKLDYLFPAGARLGESADITAGGSFGAWPVDAWVDRPGLEVSSQKDKGKLSVRVAADAQPGVYWLRLYNADGASSLRPFIVSTLPEVVEKEPNNGIADSQLLDESSVANGRLEKNGDVDSYSIRASKGQHLVAVMDANRRLGSAMDSVLQICDDRGFVLEQNDDSRGVDPQVVYSVPRDGTYTVRVFAFPATPNSSIRFAGSAAYVYRLTVTTGAYADHAMPLAVAAAGPSNVALFGWNLPEQSVSAQANAGPDPDSMGVFHDRVTSAVPVSVVHHASIVAETSCSPEQPAEVTFPLTITGRIANSRDVHAFAFEGKKGQKLRFRVESDSLGFLLDPVLAILDANGKLLKEVDDTNKRRDCEMTWSPPADGDYQLRVRDLHRGGGFRYVYRLTCGEVRPTFALNLAKDSYVLTTGKPLEIEVTVDRKDGFADEIDIVAEGLPESCKVAAAVSKGKGDSAKKVKLVVNCSEGTASTAFSVTGRSKGENGDERVARFAISGIEASSTMPWLTVVAPK